MRGRDSRTSDELRQRVVIFLEKCQRDCGYALTRLNRGDTLSEVAFEIGGAIGDLEYAHTALEQLMTRPPPVRSR